MVTPESHFASVLYAVSTEAVLSFLACINKGHTHTHTHTHTDILFSKLLNSPLKHRKAVAEKGAGRESFKGLNMAQRQTF